LTHRRKA